MRGFRAAAAAGLALTGLLLAACTASPAVSTTASAQPAGGTADCDSVTTCYTPQQIQVAYGIKPLLDHGIDGRGETVVLPELAEPALNEPLVSNMRQDMTRFDQVFGLPAAQLRVNTSLAGRVAHPWYAFGEEVLDAEMVHVIAPGATIVIDLVKNTALNYVKPAVAAAIASLRLAEAQGGIVSMSAVGQTGGENCDTRAEVASLHAALRAAAAHQVTVVAASGDIGVVGEPCTLARSVFGSAPFTPVKAVNLPASDPLVLAAGGTSLNASHKTGQWISETGWGLPYGGVGTTFQASGGGFSQVFAKPGYQDGIPGIGADARRARRVRRRQRAHRDGHSHRHAGRRDLHPEQRRDQRERADLGWADRAGRPVRPPPPGLRQPGAVPDRGQPGLPPGLPRHHQREQHGQVPAEDVHRLPRRTGLGPGHRPGQPGRAVARPAAGPRRPALTPPISNASTRWRPAVPRRAVTGAAETVGGAG